MALNDTFKILPKNKISLKADLSPLLPRKEFAENMFVKTAKRSKKIFEAN